MRVTLIEPAMIKHAGYGEKPMFTFQPLTLSVLASMTPPDVEVEVFDDRIESINYDQSTDLVGISVKTFSARRAYEIAAEYRRRDVPVVMGGHHPSLMTAEALEHADAVVVGEAESVWEKALDDASKHKIERVYRGEHTNDFPICRLKRSVFEGKKYIPITMVENSRGCPFNCSFCSVTTFFGHTCRYRSPQSIVDEITRQNNKNIFFVDDNIVGDPERAKALFRELIPLKVRWVSQASISMTQDLELMDLMQRSGCAGLLVGLESITLQNLKQIRKGWNTKQSYAESLRIVREHGIAIVGSFILGLDEDNPEALDATLELAVREKMFAALFNLLIPYPGTALYTAFQTAGRLLHPRWWLDPQYTYGKVVFHPRHFEPDELSEKRLELYRRFYGVGSIFRRSLDLEANSRNLWQLFTYLILNSSAYNQELLRQGQPLGSH